MAAASLLATPTTAPGQDRPATRLPRPVRDSLPIRARAILSDHPIPGMAVAVVRGDRLLYAGGFGHADREAELDFEPGSDWSYSNFGYAVLGHVLERASGRPYETLVTGELLEPLGMEATTVTLWPELRTRLATPYYFDESTGALTRYTPWDEEALAPAGGLSSTVEDLARFASFLFRARAGSEPDLPASIARELTGPQRRVSDDVSYGMGWFVAEREGVGPVAYHGGGVDGYSAWMELALEREIGVVILVNSGEGEPIVDLARWVLDRMSGGDAGGTEGPEGP